VGGVKQNWKCTEKEERHFKARRIDLGKKLYHPRKCVTTFKYQRNEFYVKFLKVD